MDFYGPALPPGYVKPNEDDESDNECSPHPTKESNSTKLIGPQCPSFLTKKNEDDSFTNTCTKICNDVNAIGPHIPSHIQNSPVYEEENSLDKIWGPVPTQIGEEINDIKERKAAIDKRAEAMKDKLDNKIVPAKLNEREEWMTVPDISSRNQLGAISRCLAPSKSSSSTSKNRQTHSHSSRNEKTTKELKKYNKSRRSESLLEEHKKKLKKEEKKEKSKSKEERKAFDRDEMAVRHFTKSQVNSVIEKAKYLNSRFAAGNKQYL